MRSALSLHKMRDLCEITSSKRIYASDYKLDGVPFYRGKEISEKHRGNLDVSTELFIDREKFEQIRAKFGVPQAGDLLLTSVGSLGSPYMVREGEEFYFKDGNLTWFRNFNNLTSQYLYYWLLSPQGRNELSKCTIGSSQPAYIIVLLKEMEIDLLPIPTQRKIAAILSNYDDLIENNLRRIKILEEMAQNLYREWFVHFRFPGHENVKLVETSQGLVPEGWEVKKLGELIDFSKGKKPTHTAPFGDIPALLIESLNNGVTEYTNDKKIIIAEKYDVVMVMDGASSGKVYIGQYGAVGSTLGRYRPKISGNFSPFHLYFFLIENIQAISDNNIGSAIPHANKNYINQMEVVLPGNEIEKSLNEIVDPIINFIRVLKVKNENLARTRDLLLPKLISGELDVSEIDFDIEVNK